MTPTPVAPLVAGDPVRGTWQRGAEMLDITANGVATVITTAGTKCRIGQPVFRDIRPTGPGTYTAGKGDYGVGDSACTTTTFTPGTAITVAGDSLNAGADVWTRLPAVLPYTEPVIGRWQSEDASRVLAVDINGVVHYEASPVACRVDQLEGHRMTPTGSGSYTVQSGVFTGDDCTASSFRTVTLVVGADNTLQVAGTDIVWDKISQTPPSGGPVIAKERNSLIVLHHNLNGRWVPCALAVSDKSDEIQELLTALNLDQIGVSQMDAQTSVNLDTVMLGKNPDNELTKDLFRPLREAIDQAAAGPIGTSVAAQIGEDAQGSFKAVCVRRS